MTKTSIRVEPVDHRHPAWRDVLAAIFAAADPQAVLLSEDGWLSSRQTVLAAFDGEQVVGHLCFRIEPLRHQGRPAVRSRMDSFSVDPSHLSSSVEDLLLDRAQSHARLMKCTLPQRELATC